MCNIDVKLLIIVIVQNLLFDSVADIINTVFRIAFGKVDFLI